MHSGLFTYKCDMTKQKCGCKLIFINIQKGRSEKI